MIGSAFAVINNVFVIEQEAQHSESSALEAPQNHHPTQIIKLDTLP